MDQYSFHHGSESIFINRGRKSALRLTVNFCSVQKMSPGNVWTLKGCKGSKSLMLWEQICRANKLLGNKLLGRKFVGEQNAGNKLC